MKRTLLLFFVSLCLASAVSAGEAPQGTSFAPLSQSRWQTVLGNTPKQGTADFADGSLCLKSRWKEPCEVEAHSRYLLSGDFSVRAVYSSAVKQDCRSNAGLIFETKNGGVSYKCYVATTPENGRFYRVRQDRYGVTADETAKGAAAPETGEIRITRKAGKLTFYTRGEKGWEAVHAFSGECVKPLGIRVKLATGGTVSEYKEACPAGFCLKELVIEESQQITER